MLNKEKWAKEIIDIALQGRSIAVVSGIPTPCSGTSCADCELDDKTYLCGVLEWGNSEYKEPHPCANCKVDDKVWVRHAEYAEWKPRYFAELKNGMVYAFACGSTSWTAGDGGISAWAYAKPYIEGVAP